MTSVVQSFGNYRAYLLVENGKPQALEFSHSHSLWVVGASWIDGQKVFAKLGSAPSRQHWHQLLKIKGFAVGLGGGIENH